MSNTPRGVYAGEFHYWRHEADAWPGLLTELAELGLAGVSTCVPWSVHERHKGSYSFEKNHDLASFIALCADREMPVHLRLGPLVGAEVTGFGVPERVLGSAACQVVTGRGTPLWLPWPTKMWPAPSFASAAFQEEVSGWFAALGMHLEGAQASVSVACDRRLLGRTAAFDGDYHEDAIEWWLEYSDGHPAPRTCADGDLPRVLRWVNFAEEYEARSVAWLSAAAIASGLRLAEAATNVHIGGAPWFPVVSDFDQKNSVLREIASGTREVNFYMAVARERWSGDALESEWIPQVLSTLRETNAWALHRKAPIAVVTHRAETRAAIATCALSGASAAVTDWMQLGPSGSAELSLDESARRYPRWVAAVTEALDLAEVPYQLLGERDLHKITSETSAVVAPTLRRIDGSVWGALHALGMTGMRVVLGPGVPREDEFGDSLGDASAMPQGAGLLAAESLDDLEGLAADLLGLAGELGDLWIAPESANATCTPFYDDTETVRLCFVRNRGSSELRANVNVPLGCVLRDGITGTCIEEAGGIAEVALLADEVRIFAVEASP